MKKLLTIISVSLLCAACSSSATPDINKSNRKERKAITEGNSRFYDDHNYLAAIKSYSNALKANSNSPEALFNLGVAQMAQAEKLKQANDTTAYKLAEAAESNLSVVAKMTGRAFPIAALAYYNLGNYQFRQEKYDEAIDFYKESLRIRPDFDECRRNLRIAQLKKENQDKNQDQNKQQQQQQQQQQQDQDQDKDQDKDQNQDQNKDQNQDQQNQDQQDQGQNQNQSQNQNQGQQQNKPKIDKNTANQILQAMENKEQGSRARLIKGGGKKVTPPRSRKQW
jgi:tetratricopeptide (TPR) repeat protein